MKLMPPSRAFATIRVDVASSVGPPNIMVPRQIGEIFRPLRPRLRYCMGWSFECDRHSGFDAAHRPGMTESASSLRGACHRARIRATRWLAMTTNAVPSLILQHLKHAAGHGD